MAYRNGQSGGDPRAANTTNGQARGAHTPYTFTPQQRQIVVMIHQAREPLSVNDLVGKLGRGWGESSLRDKLKRCVDRLALNGEFLVPAETGEGKYNLTVRSEEIAMNIVAAAITTTV